MYDSSQSETITSNSYNFNKQRDINMDRLLAFIILFILLIKVQIHAYICLKSIIRQVSFYLIKYIIQKMNFFLQGDYKIKESWDNKSNKSNNSRNSNSRERPKSRNIKDNNSALLNAGKNVLNQGQPSSDLLDDRVANKILRDFQAEIPPPPSSAKSQKKIPMNDIDRNKKLPPKQQKNSLGDDNLMTSMANRLKQLQVTCKSQREEIKQKSTHVQKLRTQNEFLKGMRNDSSKVFQEMESIKGENAELKKKLQQMEKYLKKYGVKWVGYNVQGKLDHQSLKKDIKKPKFNYRLPAQIDINTIQRRVEQLNAGLQSQGMGTQVYSQNGVHKFRKAEPLAMGFFGNGIAIKGFKFFPYKSKQSLQILSDLVDGYFPYVLKNKYPNGVFLNVVDKISVKYEESSGQKQIISNFESIENKQFAPPSKEQFLNNLPKQVIKNGKVIDIRGAIQKRLNGQPQSIKEENNELQQTQRLNTDYEEVDGSSVFLSQCYAKIKNQELTQEQICTLKIRTDEGKICVLHLQKSALVGNIYEWMRKIVDHKKKEKKQFVLMGNYPRRIYQEDDKENLEELGLFPNAMLHIHNKEK